MGDQKQSKFKASPQKSLYNVTTTKHGIHSHKNLSQKPICLKEHHFYETRIHI